MHEFTRPTSRSSRRRANPAYAFGAATYVAAYTAFLLGVLSLFAATGAAALVALAVALAFGACTALTAAAGRRRPAPPLRAASA